MGCVCHNEERDDNNNNTRVSWLKGAKEGRKGERTHHLDEALALALLLRQAPEHRPVHMCVCVRT